MNLDGTKMRELCLLAINGDGVIIRYDDESLAIEHLWMLCKQGIVDVRDAAMAATAISAVAMKVLVEANR